MKQANLGWNFFDIALQCTRYLPAMLGAQPANAITHSADAEKVLMIPGYGLSSWALQDVGNNIHRAGMDVTYGSFSWQNSRGVEGVMEDISKQLHLLMKDGSAPHIVTHSLGGPILLETLEAMPKVRVGSIHLITPPHKGIENIADIRPSQVITDMRKKWKHLYTKQGPAGNIDQIIGYVAWQDSVVRSWDQYSRHIWWENIPSQNRIFQHADHLTLLEGTEAKSLAQKIVTAIEWLVEKRIVVSV